MDNNKKPCLEELAKQAKKWVASNKDRDKFYDLMQEKGYNLLLFDEYTMVWFKNRQEGKRVFVRQKFAPYVCEYAELKKDVELSDFVKDVYQNLVCEDPALTQGIVVGIGVLLVVCLPRILQNSGEIAQMTILSENYNPPKLAYFAAAIISAGLAYYSYSKFCEANEREQREERAMKHANVFVSDKQYAIERALVE